MAAISCGSMLNRCSLTVHSRLEQIPIKLGMIQFSPLFSQKTEASMVGMVLASMVGICLLHDPPVFSAFQSIWSLSWWLWFVAWLW